ncbi:MULTISPECIES: hypothetical protein [Streptomyces]|nr:MULTISPECIES: hypothetical protein [Streptomyces]
MESDDAGKDEIDPGEELLAVVVLAHESPGETNLRCCVPPT